MKIEAKDLRIGNYVNVPREDQSPFRIDLFEHYSSDYGKVGQTNYINGQEFHPLTWELNDLSGIPLTPEILDKAGFEKRFDVYHEHPLIDWLYIEDERNIMVGFIHECGSQCISTIQYLHQLQNVIFALTGQELNIEL